MHAYQRHLRVALLWVSVAGLPNKKGFKTEVLKPLRAVSALRLNSHLSTAEGPLKEDRA